VLDLRTVEAQAADLGYVVGCTGREAGGRGGMVKGALAMSVAPESGRNRIMIYGPKSDGTYIIEFRMAEGESYGLVVPDVS